MSADSVEQHYVDGFIANLNNAPQQMGARLTMCVDTDLGYSRPGQMFNADDITDDDDEVVVTSRAPDSPSSFSENTRRVGFFTSSQKGRFIDDLDKVRMLSDPTNATMAGMMATKARATDDSIIAGLLGAARSGATGGTSVAFDTTNNRIAVDNRKFLHASESSVVAANGNLPLTVGKVIYAKNKLDKSELEGARFFIHGSDQLSNLLASVAPTSSDYANVKALVNGETDSWMGFKFVRSERLPVASSIRSCIALVKPAYQHKERPIHNARITQRADKSYRWYAYYEVERGGVRRYDEAVIEVLCTEA